MTRLGYVQFTLFLMVLVAFAASPGSIAPAQGSVAALRALPDGTALVAWVGDETDYVTHVRADGAVLSAEIANGRIDMFQFGVLNDNEPGANRGSYKGHPVVLRSDAIEIAGVAHPLHGAITATGVVPPRLQPIAGELPQFVGIPTEDGPIVIDLETAGIVWHGDGWHGFVLRDGAHVYVLDGTELRVFDPMTFSMTHVTGNVRMSQIGGGYVWTYETNQTLITAPIVHAVRPAASPLTASR